MAEMRNRADQTLRAVMFMEADFRRMMQVPAEPEIRGNDIEVGLHIGSIMDGMERLRNRRDDAQKRAKEIEERVMSHFE